MKPTSIISYLVLPLFISLSACSSLAPKNEEGADPLEGLNLTRGTHKSTYKKSSPAPKVAEEQKSQSRDQASFQSGGNTGSQEFDEFELYKEWRRAQQAGAIDNEEYEDWRAFKEYRRLKRQQQ